jgi:hypothetical protein
VHNLTSRTIYSNKYIYALGLHGVQLAELKGGLISGSASVYGGANIGPSSAVIMDNLTFMPYNGSNPTYDGQILGSFVQTAVINFRTLHITQSTFVGEFENYGDLRFEGGYCLISGTDNTFTNYGNIYLINHANVTISIPFINYGTLYLMEGSLQIGYFANYGSVQVKDSSSATFLYLFYGSFAAETAHFSLNAVNWMYTPAVANFRSITIEQDMEMTIESVSVQVCTERMFL